MRNEALYGLASGLLEKGYPRSEVKKYLLKHNFSSDEIDHALRELDMGYKRHMKLVSFVKKQSKRGHSLESIRHHMIKHGISHEETHKAIGHIISSPQKESKLSLILAVLSIIFGLLFIFPFLPPIGFFLALFSLKSKDERARLISKIGLAICLISMVLTLYLYFSRGRTGLATGILPAVSHDSIQMFPGDTKYFFLFIQNPGETAENFYVDEFQCAPDCNGISIASKKSGEVNPGSYYQLPVKVSASQLAEAGNYVLKYSVVVGSEIERGQLAISLLPSPKDGENN